MKCPISILTLLLSITVSAQPLLKTLPQYPCVRYQCDSLHYPAGQNQMQHFYAKMDTLVLFGQGNINILHIGGSHIQADFFSHRIRTDLSLFHPENQATRGVIYPYSVAKTNNPYNYKISTTGEWKTQQNSKKPYEYNLQMGLTGVAAQTSDSTAAITFRLNRTNDGVHWEFNRLRILGYANNDSVFPVLWQENDIIESVFDSITGTYIIQLPELTDTACIRFHFPTDTLAHFTLTGILPENDRQGISYFSCGVNGAATAAWLRCTNFEHDLQLVRPDLVIFGIGINDAAVPFGDFNPETFKQNYRELITRIRHISPQCTFIFTTNNDSFRRNGRRSYAPNKNGILVQQAFYELAKEYNGVVWDIFDIMGGLGSADVWETAGLMQRDRLHFTRIGYELLGDMFYNALMSNYLKY